MSAQRKLIQINSNGDLWLLAVIEEWEILQKLLNFTAKSTKKTLKISSISNYLFSGIVTIMFSCLSPDILQTWKNCTLTISFKVFDCIVQRYDSNKDAYLMSSDNE